MRKILALLIVAAVLLVSGVSFAETDWAMITEQTKQAVVVIRTDTSTGSGFFVNSNGFILTNNHVIKDAKDITVTVNKKDGDKEISFPSKFIASDEKLDIAILAIGRVNVPVLRIGATEIVKQSDQVLMLGAPNGLQDTAVKANVSNSKRDYSGIDYFQLDGAINPGNSGGPVINSKGEVVAIATMMVKDAQNIGLALPIDKAFALLSKNNISVDISLSDSTKQLFLDPAAKPKSNETAIGSSLPYIIGGVIAVILILALVAVFIIRRIVKGKRLKKQLLVKDQHSRSIDDINILPVARNVQKPAETLEDIDIELK